MNSHSETARRLLAAALEIDAGAIPSDASIDTLDRWDSIAHMRLLLAIEKHLGRALEPMEAADVFTVEDVARLLGHRAEVP